MGDLAVTAGPTTAVLTWTGSGDDGAYGSASSYDVATVPIDAASRAGAVMATVLARGWRATECHSRSGPQPCSQYHVAVRAEDDALNRSLAVAAVTFGTACGRDGELSGGGAPPPAGPVDAPGPDSRADAQARLWAGDREAFFAIPAGLAGQPLRRIVMLDLAGRVVRVLASGITARARTAFRSRTARGRRCDRGSTS